jgi:hypothetical protein
LSLIKRNLGRSGRAGLSNRGALPVSSLLERRDGDGRDGPAARAPGGRVRSRGAAITLVEGRGAVNAREERVFSFARLELVGTGGTVVAS